MTTKFVVCVKNGLQVCWIDSSGPSHPSSCGAFQVVGFHNSIGLANELENIIALRDTNSSYYSKCTVRVGDITLHKFSGSMCSIIYNNCQVLYHGSIDVIRNLPKAIIRATEKE